MNTNLTVNARAGVRKECACYERRSPLSNLAIPHSFCEAKSGKQLCPVWLLSITLTRLGITAIVRDAMLPARLGLNGSSIEDVVLLKSKGALSRYVSLTGVHIWQLENGARQLGVLVQPFSMSSCLGRTS